MRLRLAADRDDEFVELQALFFPGRLVAYVDAAALHFRFRNLGAEADIESLSFEDP